MTTLPPHADNGNPTKICSKCKQEHPATTKYFRLDKNRKDGLYIYCKGCLNKSFNIKDVPEGYKRCSLCKEIYQATLEFFSRHQMGEGGLRSQCKKCIATKHLEYTSDPEVKDHIRAYGEEYQSRPAVKQHRRSYHQIYYSIPENNTQKRIIKHNRRALEKKATGTYTVKDVQAQYKRQQGRCYYCKVKVGKVYHIDHVIPIARGGSNDPSNLVIACPHCNISKNDRLPHEWTKGGRLL